MSDKFDQLVKGVAESVTRRQALKRFGFGVAAMALACFGLSSKAASHCGQPGEKGTPSGYLIDAESKIASEFALGAERLLALANGTAAAHTNGEDKERANRFSSRSLARSKIKRDGLKTGTPAPDFQLPSLNGWGGVSLAARRGRRVLIVFSGPHCEPCNIVAPKLEKFHRKHPEFELVMISNGEPAENQAKVKEHGLTFPVALQQSWSVSRLYAIFATPAAYLIDQNGIIAHDVAVGTEPIFNLLVDIKYMKEPITA